MLDFFIDRRLGLKALGDLCYRMTTSQGAGVDARKSWEREARNARGHGRAVLTHVSDAVNRGSSVADALVGTGNFFPVMFHEMVTVGEESGHLTEIYRQLCEHYREQLRLRKIFLAAITWPAVQLLIALSVIGLLIWVMGLIAQMNHSQPMDMLGLGLVGTPGLIRYVSFLAVVAIIGFVLFRAVRRGLLWTAPIQRAILRIPRLGRALETLALARLTWSLYLTMDAGMEIRRALTLSLRGTRDIRFTSQIAPIVASVSRGRDLHESFASTGVFPHDFLDALEVGEQSGRLVETLSMLTNRYQDESRSAMQTLTTLAGFAVWALVAILIIVMIFRLFSSYTGMINQYSSPKFKL